jgi:O-antigen/teichoic acid export membrane protein
MNKTRPGPWSRNVLITILGNSFAPLAALATAPILAQSLGVSGRGEAAGAIAPLLLGSTVATLGIPAAVNFYVARNPGLLRKLLARGSAGLVMSGLVATALAIALAGGLSGGNPSLQNLICLAALAIVPTVLTALLQAAASGSHKWRLVTRERLLSAGVRLAAIASLAYFNELDVLRAVVVMALAPVIGAASYIPLLVKRDIDDALATTVKTKQMLHYGIRVWIGSMSGVLLTRIDQTLLVPLSDEAQLGLYVVAVTVSELPLVITNAVRDVTFSSDASEANDKRLAVAARLSTLAAFGVAGGLALTGWWWIPLLFGGDFSGAVPVSLVLLLAVVLGTPGSLAGIGLSSRGRPGLRSAALVAACATNIVLLLVLVPTIGALGAAIATLGGNMLAATLNIFLLKHHFGIPKRTFVGVRASDLSFLIGRLRRR